MSSLSVGAWDHKRTSAWADPWVQGPWALDTWIQDPRALMETPERGILETVLILNNSQKAVEVNATKITI